MTHNNTTIDSTKLTSWLAQRQGEALDFLKQLVDINSFTLNAKGANRVGDLLAQRFEDLGFTAQRRQAVQCVMEPQRSLGKHLILTRPGNSAKRIGLVGHLDTVFTNADEKDNDFHWRVDGDRIYGPGTVDMKGGDVQIWLVLSALKQFAPKLFDEITWVVMFNAAEECLCSDFCALERQQLGDSAIANLIFESSGLNGDAYGPIVQRKGRINLRTRTFGRAAHAGSSHTYGANAIAALSDVMTKLNGLTDYDNDLTANVGVVRGGTVDNRVPDFAEALTEMRAFDQKVLDEALTKAMQLETIAPVRSKEDGFETRVEMRCVKNLPTWPANPATAQLGNLWCEAAKEINVPFKNQARGGLSDGNFTFDCVPTLDGLGPAGGNAHCAKRSKDGTVDQEYVLPGTIAPCAAVAVLAIQRLAKISSLAGTM